MFRERMLLFWKLAVLERTFPRQQIPTVFSLGSATLMHTPRGSIVTCGGERVVWGEGGGRRNTVWWVCYVFITYIRKHETIGFGTISSHHGRDVMVACRVRQTRRLLDFRQMHARCLIAHNVGK